MLEFYQAYADYRDLMDLSEKLLRSLAAAEAGRRGVGGDGEAEAVVEWQGHRIDFGPSFERLSVRDAVLRHVPGIAPDDLDDPGRLREAARARGIALGDEAGPGKALVELFEQAAEPRLIAPTFITRYPTEVSPLSRRSDDDPEVADRFELFIGGREIANGFSELNDPDDQAERFRDQARQRSGGDDEAMVYDEDYVTALEYGMPPTAGEGIGIDRLVDAVHRRRLDPRRDPVPSPAPGRCAGTARGYAGVKRVFTSHDPMLAGYLRAVLEEHGIGCIVKNEYLLGGAGELPPTRSAGRSSGSWRTGDEARARRLIEEARPAEPTAGRGVALPRVRRVDRARVGRGPAGAARARRRTRPPAPASPDPRCAVTPFPRPAVSR